MISISKKSARVMMMIRRRFVDMLENVRLMPSRSLYCARRWEWTPLTGSFLRQFIVLGGGAAAGSVPSAFSEVV
jgi:hypothetical protein